ncbi:MAG TPA: zinc-binding dehydrogenase, partial [Ramlibacter sp.]|nr:zinc-binding dehydrogenase [Ramlibacter sp.]
SPGREHVPRGLGAHHVMALGALGDRQADLVIETAGTPESISAALTACRYGGQLVCCNGWRPMPPVDGWPRGVTVHDVFLGAAVDQADPQVRARIGALGAALAAQIDAGRVRVPDAGAVAPSQVPELLRRMAAGAAPGKFVIPWFQESSP